MRKPTRDFFEAGWMCVCGGVGVGVGVVYRYGVRCVCRYGLGVCVLMFLISLVLATVLSVFAPPVSSTENKTDKQSKFR